FAEEQDPGANTVQVAGADGQLPVFWLFCFDVGDIAVVESDDGAIPALVAEMARVRGRLAERGAMATELFPSHAHAWDEFREAIEAAGRKYLKVDAYEIWLLHDEPSDFGRLLKKALNWPASKKAGDLDALLSLAGIEGYDRKTRNFTVPEGNE